MTLQDIERALHARGLSPGQVAIAIEQARQRLAAHGRTGQDNSALARELGLETPYFWEAI